jgi:hypothetical protein
MKGFGALLADDLQIRLPHVGAAFQDASGRTHSDQTCFRKPLSMLTASRRVLRQAANQLPSKVPPSTTLPLSRLFTEIRFLQGHGFSWDIIS